MWAASARHEVGEGKHPGPGGGPKAPLAITPRHQLVMDSRMPHPPTHLQDVRME